jgi:hypothetical protein
MADSSFANGLPVTQGKAWFVDEGRNRTLGRCPKSQPFVSMAGKRGTQLRGCVFVRPQCPTPSEHTYVR